jgi:predicted Ser/Thr protein kinase
MVYSNPYNKKGMITISNQFFNRMVLVGNILDGLFSSSAQCQSIVGQTRIGKSSLIEHLTDPTTIRRFNYDESTHRFIYVNCSMHASALKSPEDFYYFLLHRPLMRRGKETLYDIVGSYPINRSWQDIWEHVLLEMADKHLYLILLLDDFDKAVLHGTLLKEGLFDSLRAFGSMSPHFAWITCTLQHLPRLFDQAFRKFGISDEERMSFSEFYNIVSGFHTVELFDREDINSLITAPAKTEQIIFTRDEIQAIYAFGGRFPYFIQCACYRFFEAHQKGVVTLEKILQECQKEAIPLWTDYWNKITPQQQRVLFSVASDYPLASSPTIQNLIQSLKEASLIYEEYGHWFPFSQDFGSFIRSREHLSTGFPVNPGEHLWRQYEVKVIVGNTNHSQVVKVWDPLSLRHWAIKLLCINHEHNDQQLQKAQEKLLREAHILLSMEHKNIGKVYSVRPDPLGVIMEWIEGKSLDQIIKEHSPLSPVPVIKIGLRLAEALRYAHQKGIIHRDIKPGNIILSPDNEPILIDFDVARSEQQHTITQDENGLWIQVGTLAYSAPEQFIRSGQIGWHTDIFALGAVLYELLTHEQPYPLGNDPQKYPDRMLPQPEQQNIPKPLYLVLCDMLRQDHNSRLDANDTYNAFMRCVANLELM